MKEINVKVSILSPVVLSDRGSSNVMTGTRHNIPGAVLRGILAQRYIDRQNLGVDADKDENFRRIFLEGPRFVDCNPVLAGERSISLPFSLQKEKAGIGGKKIPGVQDLLNLDENKSAEKGMKSFRGLAAVIDGKIRTAQVKTTINFHMSRSNASERLKGSSQDGAVFNYEAIDAGQQFMGSIIGNESDLEALLKGLELKDGNFIAHMGRSRYTQYGTCKVEFSPAEPLPTVSGEISDRVILRLDTPYIPGNSYRGSAGRQLMAIVDDLNSRVGAGNFSLGQIFAGNDEIENFVGVWNMRRSRMTCLSAGTVFEVKKPGKWTDDEIKALQQLLYEGCGLRREEGFGQLRIWPQISLSCYDPDQDEKEKAVDGKIELPETVKEQIKSIVKKRIMDQLRIYAYEDVRKTARTMPSGLAHFFARLSGMLEKAYTSDKNNEKKFLRDTLQKVIQQEMEHKDDKIHAVARSRTPFQEHLEKVWVGGGKNSLREILEGKNSQPYLDPALHSLKDSLSDGEERIEALLALAGEKFDELKLDDNEYFHEYWHWFFRYARKAATRKPRRNA